ncbi:eukaryotic translation elongation factor 1 epsilon-1-like [Pomacea canaliculata]|uniref:eukaryotic translation elongation factor 1 epsilon-1-like n=1 Tax=Pomacea canaliculata TaxID=400727 RepID=UPI000D72961C|nr:eukaryotic translation elongation factor 1 epsilon-1-like [Pomacea canaliculata]
MSNVIELRAVCEYFQSPVNTTSFSKKEGHGPPSFKTQHGGSLNGAATIARHFSKLGKRHNEVSIEDQACIDQWLEYRCSQIDRCGPQGVPVTQVLEELDSFIADKVFFVSDHLTLADLFLYHGLHSIFGKLTFQEKEKYINLSRWFDNVQQDASLRQNLLVLPFSRSSLYTSG